MSFNVGINVLEVDGRATPSIQAAPTSVTGFVIKARRGVPNKVVSVTNWSQFVEHFGGYFKGANGAYCVRGFFDNGGTTAHITRVVNTDEGDDTAVAASQTFNADGDSGSKLTVTAGYRGDKDYGAWGNELEIQIDSEEDSAGNSDGGSKPFDLIVKRGEQTLETWTGLSMDSTAEQFVEPVLNDEHTGSKFITVKADGNTKPADTVTVDEDGNEEPTTEPLIDGSDGKFPDETDDRKPEVNAFRKKVDLFDKVDIQLLCCPEEKGSKEAVVRKCLTHCEKKGDRMFVGHTPRGVEAIGMREAYSGVFRQKKAYGALYFPWIQVADPLGGRRSIPPTGHVLGAYARTERQRGIWKAPAGNAARLRGALDVEQDITDTDHTLLVKNAGVNAVRFISGQGIVIDSSRTLSTNTLWLYVNVRLLFNFVKTSLQSGLRWVVQEPNTPELWKKIKYNSVTPFLMGLWRRGAFGPGAPEEVFTVKVDAENNPPERIQQGILTVEVYFYPSRPAETIVLTIGQQEGGASASEG